MNLNQLRAEGYPAREQDVEHLSPFIRKHLGVHGRYNFVLPDLAPGRYTLTATIQGFKQFVRKDLRLDVDLIVQLVLHRASPMRVAWSAGATSWPHGRLISPDGTHTGRGPDRE